MLSRFWSAVRRTSVNAVFDLACFLASAVGGMVVSKKSWVSLERQIDSMVVWTWRSGHLNNGAAEPGRPPTRHWRKRFRSSVSDLSGLRSRMWLESVSFWGDR